MFVNVDLEPDIIVIVKFYLRHRTERTGGIPDNHLHDDETLVAWTYVPLLLSAIKGKSMCFIHVPIYVLHDLVKKAQFFDAI